MTKNTKAPALQREIRLRPRNECNAVYELNYESNTGITKFHLPRALLGGKWLKQVSVNSTEVVA